MKYGWLILVALGLLVFTRSCRDDTTLVRGDVSTEGLERLHREYPACFTGRWVADDGLGRPTAANPITPSGLLCWLIGGKKAGDIYYLIHVLIMGVGGWFLLRDLTKSSVAATVGGVWFMLQPHIFTHIQPGHIGCFWMSAWMPWCLLCLRYAVREKTWTWWALVGGLGGCMLAGSLDVGLLLLIFAGCYGLFMLWVADKTWIERGRALGFGVVAIFVALAISFPAWSSAFALYGDSGEGAASQSVEATEKTKYEWATQWSVPPEEALEFIVPGAYGWGTSCPYNPYRGRVGQSAEYAATGRGLPRFNDINNYLGLLMLGLCAVGIVTRRRDKEVWFLVGAAVVACVLSFGKYTPVYHWFYDLPGMSSIRNPIKWFTVTSVCVGMLGTIGIAFLVERQGKWWRRGVPWCLGLLLFVDVMRVNIHYMPSTPIVPEIRLPITDTIRQAEKPFRVVLLGRDGPFYVLSRTAATSDMWERPNIPTPRTEDDSNIMLRRLAANVYKELQVCNVRYVLGLGTLNHPAFTPVAGVKWGESDVVLHEFRGFLPRYNVVGRWRCMATTNALDYMASTNFNPQTEIVLHDEAAEHYGQLESISADCNVISYEHRRVVLRVRSSHPAVLVDSTRYDKSWRVYVNGERVPIWKANWMLRACPVPSGESVVEWRHIGDGGRGLVIGFAGWIVVCVAVIGLRASVMRDRIRA